MATVSSLVFDAPLGVAGARIAAAVAVGTAAFALDAVQNTLNDRLKWADIRRVQVRAGLDYGRLDYVRIGSAQGSEVNVLGFAANFAAKCEKAALAWEVVAGEELAGLLPSEHLTHHGDSPEVYTRDGERRAYRYYDVAWAGYLRHVGGIPDQLNGRPVSQVGVR